MPHRVSSPHPPPIGDEQTGTPTSQDRRLQSHLADSPPHCDIAAGSIPNTNIHPNCQRRTCFGGLMARAVRSAAQSAECMVGGVVAVEV